MTSSVIRLICPNLRCRTVLAVPGASRGKMVRCRNCSTRVQVPGSSADAPAGAASAERPTAGRPTADRSG